MNKTKELTRHADFFILVFYFIVPKPEYDKLNIYRYLSSGMLAL